jgi:hypothetical protein
LEGVNIYEYPRGFIRFRSALLNGVLDAPLLTGVLDAPLLAGVLVALLEFLLRINF